MRVGYVRCSTAEQNEARQLKMMEEQKVEKIFIDKASGKNVDRKDFKAMMAFVRAGDTVIVESISPPKKTGVCLVYCFMLSPVISLGAVPHHHLALSVKGLTYSSNS